MTLKRAKKNKKIDFKNIQSLVPKNLNLNINEKYKNYNTLRWQRI